MEKTIYRPEIDGLRAIAVFSVVLFHAKFFLFNSFFLKGGFIGVDIFFAISGYLITRIILKEIIKKNNFSFKNFYERRIRRILPVLLFVIIVSLILGFFLLLPESLIDLSKSTLSVIFFISNIYFNYNGSGYAGEDSLIRPLIHTWSLSVEEQFYILFPIFLIIIYKFFKKNILIILLLAFLISLLFAAFMSKNYPGTNFYQLPSRGFELLFGSLLAYLEINNHKKKNSYNILNKVCPLIGAIMIVCALLYFDYDKIYHPSYITLIPLLGLGLIIWFCRQGGVVTNVLSNKFLVFIGLISYSIYLWHYPIFAYLRYLYLFQTPQIKIIGILLTILLSVFSYYFIEKPFREKKVTSVKKLIIYILFCIIILITTSLYIIEKKDIQTRFSNTFTEELSINLIKQKIYENNKFKDVVLIGDSHARRLLYSLNAEMNKLPNNFFADTKNDSLYLQNFKKINRKTGLIIEKPYDNFIKNNKERDKLLEENKNLIIVLSQRWSWKLLESEFSNQEFLNENQNKAREIIDYLEPIGVSTSSLKERQKYLTEGLKSTLYNIVNKGHILVIIYPIPEIGFDVPRLMNRDILKNKFFNKSNKKKIYSVKLEEYQNRNKKIFKILDELQGQNIHRIYPENIFCNTAITNYCIANSKERLLYQDDNHLSLEGSQYITKEITNVIKKINQKKK